ncbi:MAG: NAD(+)/NADH kinase [Treponema sp.]|jgi:NAD+ kinase|nr:NAD(+)/NADH kinase [Treponema sp.]
MAEKKALLFINGKRREALALGEEIRSELESRAYGVDFFSFENKAELPGAVGYDISFTLGGDGTVLYASRIMAPQETPVLPVNLGTLGFIAAVIPNKWKETFENWEKGRVPLSRRLMLETAVERKGETLFRSFCLNDTVISASGIAKLIRLEVEAETAGGDLLSLGPFRADGLIVATPTGSTGYSVAAGGPIIDPEMEAVIINPICPFTLSNRPIVVPADGKVLVLVEREQRSAVLLTVDGQLTLFLEPEDRVVIRRAPFALCLIASGREIFYQALCSKLAWSGGSPHVPCAGGTGGCAPAAETQPVFPLFYPGGRYA